jgi:hypothetical protein
MTQGLEQLQLRLQYRFHNPDLLRRALTHRSFSADHYERLEFLGDSVLGLAVSDMLYAQLGSLALARLELRLRALEVLPKLEDLHRLRALLLVQSSHARLGPLRATSDGDLPKGVRVQLCRGPHVLAWRVDTWRVERLRLEGEGGRHPTFTPNVPHVRAWRKFIDLEPTKKGRL